MNYGFNYGFFGQVIAPEPIELIMTVGKRDTFETYGYAPHATPPYGGMTPVDFMGMKIYNMISNSVSGINGVNMGELGGEKIGDEDFFSASIGNYVNNPVTYIWNEAQGRYVCTDLELANYIKSELNNELLIEAAPSVFNPLEEHPYWTFITGASTTESSLSWANNDISKEVATNGLRDVLLALNDLNSTDKFYDMEVSCNLLRFNGGSTNSEFPLVVRAFSHDNFIGLRSANDVLEVYERVGGTFRSLMNSAHSTIGMTFSDVVTLRVKGSVVTVLVNDVDVGAYNSTFITEIGYLGCMDRGGAAGDISSSYIGVDLRMAYIGGSVQDGGSTVYLAFDDNIGGVITTDDVIISVDGVPTPQTTFDVSGSQIILGMITNIGSGTSVTVSITGVGSNVPDLEDAVVANTALEYVTHGLEVVIYKGEMVTYNG